MKIIEFINAPFVFTSTGERIEIKTIKGSPRIGSELSEDNEVLASTADLSDCPGGSCPVK